MLDANIQTIGTIIFGIALLHTFSASFFETLAHRMPRHRGLFHLLGEVEVVFGFWAFVLIIAMAFIEGGAKATEYAESRQYTEPLFVFVVMVISASRPIFSAAQTVLHLLARFIPFPTPLALTWLGFAFVPLAGSLLTEPAAMTLAAMTLAPIVFRKDIPEWPKYAALGVLFVNISIGGTLTSFAAPPVLMVAKVWNWDSAYMFTHFGWRAASAVLINATIITYLLRKYIPKEVVQDKKQAVPLFVSLIHLAILIGVVFLAHHPVLFIGLFLFFLGYVQAYERFQSPLILKEALLVAFFLAGLVVLGGMQQWWLQPILTQLGPLALFFGALGLTAVTDNAALTYLGSLVQGMSEESKFMLVAGAVCGGGLTVIANAPNPAGAALLRRGFKDDGIGAGGLFLGASIPTVIAAAFFLI